jgi:hypothetical protein
MTHLRVPWADGVLRTTKIEVDYRKPYWTVYRKFFTLMLALGRPNELGRTLGDLTLNNDTEEQPSWLPNFSRQGSGLKHAGTFLASEQCFGSEEYARWSNDGEVLMLRGVVLDAVDRLHDIPEDFDEWLKMVPDVTSGLRSSAQKLAHGSPEEIIQASRQSHVCWSFIANFPCSACLGLDYYGILSLPVALTPTGSDLSSQIQRHRNLRQGWGVFRLILLRSS